MARPGGDLCCPESVRSMAIDLGVSTIEEMRNRRSAKWARYDPDVLSVALAEMDYPLARPIGEALLSAVRRADLGYTQSAPPSLARAFAGFAGRRLGWSVDQDQVVLIPDVMSGVREICRLLLARGDAVALPTPAYGPFLSELPRVGARLIEVPLESDGGLSLDALDAALALRPRLFVLVNPHNPTGRVFRRDELAALAEKCAERDIWVVADEIHAPLALPGAVHTSWLDVSAASRHCGIVVTSVTKGFNITALKTALMVTESDRARDLVTQLPAIHDRASILGVIATEVACTECDVWLDVVISQLDDNRARLRRHLSREIPEIVWHPPDATYLAWLDCRDLALGDDPATTFLLQGRVALSPGLQYGVAGAGHVRLNLATSGGFVSEAVARMASVRPTLAE